MTPTTIAIACHAGGVGKTTTTEYLARHLTERDERNVVAIDMDPQHTLSRRAGVPENWSGTTADLLTGRSHVSEAYITEHGWGLIPATLALQETAAWMQLQLSTHDHLRQALLRSDNYRDATRGWLLLDCPPAADLLTINALVAADHVIVPVIPEPKGLDGLRRMIELVAWLNDRGLSHAQVLGTVITQIDRRTNLHNEHLAQFHAAGTAVLAEIPAARGADAGSKLADAYRVLAIEIQNRIACEEVPHAG